MTRFRVTIVFVLLMLAALPFKDMLATSPSFPAYTHFVYMFGHDGFTHYVVNAWSLLVLHNLFRWYRMTVAYLVAVAISYVCPPAKPMIGASVIVCLFIGFSSPWLWHNKRWTAVLSFALIVITCFIPGFAGVPHLVSYLTGVALCFCESYIRRIKDFIS